MKHAAAFLLFWIALFFFWLLLAGEWNTTEAVAAAAAATVAAGLGEVARTRARASLRPALGPVPSALAMVFVDFGIVMWALVTRREGVLREADASDVWGSYIATLSANAYVIDEQTTHHLVPMQKSQEPV